MRHGGRVARRRSVDCAEPAADSRGLWRAVPQSGPVGGVVAYRRRTHRRGNRGHQRTCRIGGGASGVVSRRRLSRVLSRRSTTRRRCPTRCGDRTGRVRNHAATGRRNDHHRRAAVDAPRRWAGVRDGAPLGRRPGAGRHAHAAGDEDPVRDRNPRRQPQHTHRTRCGAPRGDGRRASFRSRAFAQPAATHLRKRRPAAAGHLGSTPRSRPSLLSALLCRRPREPRERDDTDPRRAQRDHPGDTDRCVGVGAQRCLALRVQPHARDRRPRCRGGGRGRRRIVGGAHAPHHRATAGC